jgi:hypothetical protein
MSDVYGEVRAEGRHCLNQDTCECRRREAERGKEDTAKAFESEARVSEGTGVYVVST